MNRAALLERLDWDGWERLIHERGITIDRPQGSVHPSWTGIVYPIDYGYVNGTRSSDGQEIDIFVGTAGTGLVAAEFTTDFRRGDRECKFLLDCSPREIYVVHGFLNFDRGLMVGRLVMRRPMIDVWSLVRG